MKDNQINQFVTDQIRRLRQEQGMRVQEIARKAGIPLGSYSCLETGKYRLNMENLFRILQVLDAPIQEVWPDADLERPVNGVDESYINGYVASARSLVIRPVSVTDIIGIVCAEYRVNTEDLCSPSRERRLAQARTMATLLVRDEGHLTQIKLAREFNRDVSSLSHCLRRFDERLSTDKKLVRRVKRVRRKLHDLKQSRKGHPLKDVRRGNGE